MTIKILYIYISIYIYRQIRYISYLLYYYCSITLVLQYYTINHCVLFLFFLFIYDKLTLSTVGELLYDNSFNGSEERSKSEDTDTSFTHTHSQPRERDLTRYSLHSKLNVSGHLTYTIQSQQAYLGQCVGAVSVEGKHLPIKSVDVRASLYRAGARAVLLCALPQATITNTVSEEDGRKGLGLYLTHKKNAHRNTHTHTYNH